MNFKIITEREVVTTEVTEIDVTLLEYIGHKIKELKENENLNSTQLSKSLYMNGVQLSVTTIIRIEKGECPVRLMDLVAIANFFGVNIGSLLPKEAL